MSIRLTLSAFRAIRRPFSQPHPKQSPAASGQPPILLTTATIAWYRIPRTPPTCSVPQPRGTEPSKAPQRGSVPYHTHVRKQKPRNPNTHPRPNGPWYGTERPKPRFRHSVPQPRGTGRPNPRLQHSVPQSRGTEPHQSPSTGFRTVPRPPSGNRNPGIPTLTQNLTARGTVRNSQNPVSSILYHNCVVRNPPKPLKELPYHTTPHGS